MRDIAIRVGPFLVIDGGGHKNAVEGTGESPQNFIKWCSAVA